MPVINKRNKRKAYKMYELISMILDIIRISSKTYSVFFCANLNWTILKSGHGYVWVVKASFVLILIYSDSQ